MNYPFYLKRNCIKQAMEAFYIYKSTGYKGNSNYGKDTEANLLCGEGELYLKVNKLDSAYICLAKAYALSESYSNKRAITNNLSEYFKRNHNYEMAMQYAQLSSLYNDSCFIELRNAQLQQTMSLYNYNRNKNIARAAEQKAYKRTIIMYITITILVLVTIGGLIYHKNSIKKKTEKVRRIKNIYKEKSEELNAIQKELKSIQELNAEKLCAIIAEKEEKIQEIKNELDLYEKNFAFLDIQKKREKYKKL